MNAVVPVDQLMLTDSGAPSPQLQSPKRAVVRSRSDSETYPYYAGFSEAFVADAMSLHTLPESALVLDPWNGSGTTIKAACGAGYRAVGYDLNPVMVVVARTRLANRSDFAEARSILWECATDSCAGNCNESAIEPLSEWIDDESADRFRWFVTHLYGSPTKDYINDDERVAKLVNSLSVARCLLLLSAFRSFRLLLALRDTSNPTWTILPAPGARKALAVSDFQSAIAGELDILYRISDLESQDFGANSGTAEVYCASSEALPLPDKSIDLIVTSPPYCTRIDYAVATLPELSLLGLSSRSVKSGLRRQLIGTTAIKKSSVQPSETWGAACLDVLQYTFSHASHGSRSYYYKNQMQYFASMHESIKEMARVSRFGARSYVVVQESFYKEKKINLPLIISQMAKNEGFDVEATVAFEVKTNMVNINTRSRQYRKDSDVREEVLILKRK